jgi:hypothetical protein
VPPVSVVPEKLLKPPASCSVPCWTSTAPGLLKATPEKEVAPEPVRVNLPVVTS